MLRATSVLITAVVVAALGAAAPALAAAPSNDDRADARPLTLPASLDGTTAGATLEQTEPGSNCQGGTKNSVWYVLNAVQNGRVSVRFDAGGDLDATVDAYQRTRSQTTPVDCDSSDKNGRADLSFTVKKGQSYLIRIAQQANSASGPFKLDVFIPQPEPTFPGPPLSAGGVKGVVDVLSDQNDAYRVRLHSGVTYRVNLSVVTGRCANLTIYGPAATSFDSQPRGNAPCSGYAVFTPGPGEGGRYSLLVGATRGVRGSQRYHLQVGRALADDTAPGIPIRNFARLHGRLDGHRTDVVDLYRFDVTRHSELRLTLDGGDDLGLTLLNDRGRRISSGTGAGELTRTLRPGRYFAAVRAVPGTRGGAYALTRVSRATTRTHISLPASASPGTSVPITASVSGADGGRVAITVERFDPLAGWLFLRRFFAGVSGSSATVSWTPPAVGRYRATAAYRGTRGAAASQSGFARILVAGPLSQ